LIRLPAGREVTKSFDRHLTRGTTRLGRALARTRKTRPDAGADASRTPAPRTVRKPQTGTPAPAVNALPARLGVGPSQRRRERPTPRRRPVASADYVAAARGENPTGGRVPEADAQRPATEHLREDHKTQGSPGRSARSTLFTKPWRGRHSDTARLTPGAKAQEPRPSGPSTRPKKRRPATMELAVDGEVKRQVGPRRRRGALTRGVG
jgi:hypothetical protein